MRILVCGGAGFIGSRLVARLREKHHEVAVVDLHWFTPKIRDIPVEDELRDCGTLTQNQLSKFDTVIFLAGLSNDPMADFSPSQNFQANAATPAYLAEMSRRAGVRTFIHGGSCSVYGMAAAKCREGDIPMTTSPYGVSKLMGELGVHQQHPFMRTVLFRMGTVAGWSPRMRFDLVVNAMTKSALTTGEITIHDGTAKRPILEIGDAVRAYVHAVEDPHVNGIINLASENTTVHDIADNVRFAVESLGRKVIVKHNNMKEIRSYSVSIARAERLGFWFTGSVTGAANEIISKFSTIDDPEDPRYYNIKTFTANRKRGPLLAG